MQGRTLFPLAVVFTTLLPTLGAGQVVVATDTALVRLRELVIHNNPELAALRASLDAAELRVRSVGYSSPATVTAEIEEVPRGIDIAKAGSMRLEVTRDFTSRALRDGRRAIAAFDIEQQRIALHLLEQSLSVRVAQQIERIAAYAAIRRRLASEDSLLLGIEESVRSRFASGDARYIDVLRLRTERLRVRSELASLATDASVARRTLLALVGDSASTDREILAMVQAVAEGTTLPVIPSSPFVQRSVDSLVEASGRVRTLGLQLERSRRQAALVLAEQKPAFSAGLGLQRFSGERGFDFGPTVVASLSLPFTATGRTRALTGAAEAQVRATAAHLRATRIEVRAELAVALDRYESALTRASYYDTALLTGARQERESALASFRSGTVTLIELLDFERALARAEIDYLRSRIAAQDALAGLMEAWTRMNGEPSHTQAMPDEWEPSR
jgi:outer membrane protein, heavy metal efflux system